MAGYCMSIGQKYFYEPKASKNTAHECNVQPYSTLMSAIMCLLPTFSRLCRQHQHWVLHSHIIVRTSINCVVSTWYRDGTFMGEYYRAYIKWVIDGTMFLNNARSHNVGGKLCKCMASTHKHYLKHFKCHNFNSKLWIIILALTSLCPIHIPFCMLI